MGLANVMLGLDLGIREYESSIAGLGGCPFAPGAAGNVATEDLIRALTRSGASLSPDLERVRAASDLLSSVLGRPLRSS